MGATALDEYRNILRDAALEKDFNLLWSVNHIEDTIEILKGLREHYEQHHRLKITDDALEAAHLGDRYISIDFYLIKLLSYR